MIDSDKNGKFSVLVGAQSLIQLLLKVTGRNNHNNIDVQGKESAGIGF